MPSELYGYIRVSTKEQNESRQLLALLEYGVTSANIYSDRQSGGDFDRPGYKRLINELRPDDILVIKSIDRLGRNYGEILEQWRLITHELRCDIAVLDMPLLDTRRSRDLIGTLISDIILQLLSYVAETEREFIRRRQRGGIDAARANGVHLGRAAMTRPDNYEKVKLDWSRGAISAREAARLLGVSHTTFRNWVGIKPREANT